jgi:hypothetical protein
LKTTRDPHISNGANEVKDDTSFEALWYCIVGISKSMKCIERTVVEDIPSRKRKGTSALTGLRGLFGSSQAAFRGLLKTFKRHSKCLLKAFLKARPCEELDCPPLGPTVKQALP